LLYDESLEVINWQIAIFICFQGLFDHWFQVLFSLELFLKLPIDSEHSCLNIFKCIKWDPLSI
jgi:hypothetical protein